ncbi:hypothetical protein PSA7680_02076 [Pseudoruegeria aquimaris]|uniref:Uncharacterized protein n=1 Tax=Pseudoruegeria aquimaris TaxID=393663 RepID=A0A1Y5SKT2_9RHOB|nr:tetratricopeptide repeat protein [Pseudoruegeria aquimaris]SLN41897.1 hypothetical protein PSA7680_02076 [Pseudoruegeria aquimaris]
MAHAPSRALALRAPASRPALALALGAGLLLAPLPLLAAGSSSSDVSAPKCENGQVWDDKSEKCVDAQDSRLDDDSRYEAVRQYAYAGELDAALVALAAMSDQQDDRVLTYRGFIARKQGDAETANAFYQMALRQNPDNILARSYMGQGYAEAGRMELAQAQLSEIRKRGGRNTWAEVSLRLAIGSGKGFSY